MAIHRLRRLRSGKAFSLPEVVIALLIASLTAALLLLSVRISSNYDERAADLQRNLDSAVSDLYKGNCDILAVKPPVRINSASGWSNERLDGEDGAALSVLSVNTVTLSETEITLYYFGGDFAEDYIS